MIKLKKFFQTTLVGGLVAILPLGIIILVFRWIIGLIERYLKPLVLLFETDSSWTKVAVYLILVVSILVIFFFVGLFIQTRIGNFVRNHIERTYLMKIPGYKTARDIVTQFMGGTRSFFSEVVLVDVYGTGNLQTGFVTDECEDFITVFIPTSPNPTSGFVFHMTRDKVFKSNVPVDIAVKSIISCGAGSREVLAKKDSEPLKREFKQ
jgi:uncharacterized membrane protein